MLEEGRFKVGMRWKFLIQTVVNHWHKPTKETVGVPSLRHSEPGWTEPCEVWCGEWPITVGWNWVIFKVPSNPSILLFFFPLLS